MLRQIQTKLYLALHLLFSRFRHSEAPEVSESLVSDIPTQIFYRLLPTVRQFNLRSDSAHRLYLNWIRDDVVDLIILTFGLSHDIVLVVTVHPYSQQINFHQGAKAFYDVSHLDLEDRIAQFEANVGADEFQTSAA
jgi:hypothetical protein